MSGRTVALRRFVATACDGPFGSSLKSDHYSRAGARVVRLGNIGSADWVDTSAVFIDLDYWRTLERHDVRKGDLLVAGLGDQNNQVGRACVAPELGQAMVKADCYRLRLVAGGADAAFMAYFLVSTPGRSQSEAMADGSTRQRLTLSKALSIRVPSLPVDQQRRIADFLDAETSRIDDLISAKKQMIYRLQELRLATTFSEVTGGSHPDHRSTGIPWMPAIPADWREAKLTLLASLGSGHTPSRSRPEWWVDCTIPWITTGEVRQVRDDRVESITQTRECISALGMANSSATLHPSGTVFLCRTASAGYSGIMGQDMAVSQDFATWTCGPKLRPRYLLLCLRAMRADLLGRLATGSTHKTIYMPDIEGLRIPVPSVDEQDEIVDRTWNRLRAIDSASGSVVRQIELLRERRQALITAAVSGEMTV